MLNFDSEYRQLSDMLYGNNPSLYLEAFVNREIKTRGDAIDIGCGDGRNALFLAKCGFNVTAIDLSISAIKRLSEQSLNLNLRIKALVSDAVGYKYPVECYDLVVANTILDHIEKDKGNLLIEELKHSLKKDGFLFASVFTTKDPGFQGVDQQSDTARYVKRYFDPGELMDLFNNMKIIRYHEEFCLDENHGSPHYHSMARILCKKA